MDKILENEIVYTTFKSEYIIKCECLDILTYTNFKKIYDSSYASYYCNKVKVIEIYNKDIILDSVNIPGYEYLLKKDSIITLKSFKENEHYKKNLYLKTLINVYYKTFLRAYMDIYKINNIKYVIHYNGAIGSFINDIIDFYSTTDIFKEKSNYTAMINYKGEYTHTLQVNGPEISITYYNILINNKLYYYNIIYNTNNENNIKISRSQKCKNNGKNKQIIICDKNLKILKIYEYKIYRGLYLNKVIQQYNPITGEIEIPFSNNDKFNLIKSCKTFSQNLIKSCETFSQDLIVFYNLNYEHYLHELTCIKDKELQKAHETLLSIINKYVLV